MANFTGAVQSYDILTAGFKIDMLDMVKLLDPSDVPLVGTRNGTDNVPDGPTGIIGFSETYTEKKVEWLEDSLLLPKSTTAATLTTGDTVLTVASGERERFSTGDIIRVAGGEVVRVSSYGTTADTLIITRAFAGTAATINNNVKLMGVGTGLNEGSDPENARATDRAAKHNFTEIFGPYKVEVTGSMEAFAKYGVSSEFNYQLEKLNRQLWVAIEQALIYGLKKDDTTNARRAMGGILEFISTNHDSTTTDITHAKILDQQQNIYDNGGRGDYMIVNGANRRKISAFKDNITLNRQADERVRGQVVDILKGDFGDIQIVLDRFINTADAAIVSSEEISAGWVTGRSPHFETLPKTGDAFKGMVLGEGSMRFQLEKRHAKFSALT